MHIIYILIILDNNYTLIRGFASFVNPETHFLYPGYTPMLQLDCEVMNTKIFHMQTP